MELLSYGEMKATDKWLLHRMLLPLRYIMWKIAYHNALLSVLWRSGCYPKVSEISAWSKNCKWYSSLPLGAILSLFC